MTRLSLIIPCYNESKSIPLLIDRLNIINSSEKNLEIVLVNNGSTDDSLDILKSLTHNLNYITLVNVEKNIGYGHGILSGLRVATGKIIGWTHADLQTDPIDVLKGLKIFEKSSNPELLFVKGRRHGRPFIDVVFTIGMSLFEIILLRKFMWDINAQPTLFHEDFFKKWTMPPEDFSLDLYVYYLAKKNKLSIKRFPVIFASRVFGVSHWNVNFSAKYRFIKRTFVYSLGLFKMFNKK
ncbi:glycosyltransferase family 2 protein [Candidatus Pseudothioglobus singularis]|nr:glycosyltransferase family 2 protein [Candidatus Pseudothioglobus singularis]|tara:strand:+ start:66 stop:779 length:714 start_codon:yes stop_codon:yes gene_type:complete